MKKLLILGGGTSHLPIIQLTKKLHIFAIVIDKNKDAVGLKTGDRSFVMDGGNEHDVLKIAKQEKVDGILPTGDYSVFPSSYAAEKLGLPTFGIKIAKLVTNRSILFKKFLKDKVPVPKAIEAKNIIHAKKIAEKIGYPLILKPGSSFGGSRGVVKINSDIQLERMFSYTKNNSLSKNVILEEFIDGIGHSVESITIKGKTSTLAISDRIRSTNFYCVDTRINYPSNQNYELKYKIVEAVKKAIRSSGMNWGPSHIETISKSGKVYVHDFGARGGAGGFIPTVIVPLVSGVNMMEKMILMYLGMDVGKMIPKKKNYVTFGFFNPDPGIVKKIIGVRKIKQFPWVVDINLRLKKGDRMPIIATGPDRAGYFVIKATNRKKIKERNELIEKYIHIKT